MKNKNQSLGLKILIGLSQLLVIIPGAYSGYLLSIFLENRLTFLDNAGALKLIIGLFSFAICSLPFAIIWFYIMKKTGISETEEFHFMIGSRKM